MTTLAQRLVVVLVALLTAACAATATGDPSTAATVGDRAIPASAVDETLASIRDTEAFRQQEQGDASGEFVLDARRQLATQVVRSELLAQLAEREGIVVTDEDVAQARSDLVEQLGGEEAFLVAVAEQGLTEEFVLGQLRDQQYQLALQGLIGQDADLGQFIQAEVADIPIEVNPRYGVWDPTALAVAPFDPLAPVAGENATGDAAPSGSP